MADLQTHLDAVRGAWRKTELLKGLALLAADVVVVVLALIALDAIYHLPGLARGTLLVAALGAVAAVAAWGMARPLKRRLADDNVALYVEGRYPQLQGTLISAVEYGRRPREGQLESELVDALMLDCLERAAQVDFSRVIDRRRFTRRATLAAVLFAFFLGAVAIKPRFFAHELQRVLTPWKQLPLTADELLSLQQRQQAEEERRRLLEEAARASQGIKIEFTVTPGNTELLRGENLRVQATASRIVGPLEIQCRSSGGEWRGLPMEEDPAKPETFVQVLRDITDDLSYRVVMRDQQSEVFSVTVYDPATIKELRLRYRFPSYAGMPDRTVTGMDGSIEGIEGTKVDVTLVATSAMGGGSLLLDGGQTIVMKAAGNEVTGTLTVTADGDYGIRAADSRNNALPFPARFPIRMLRDEPPRIEVVYPTMDALVHPLEEAAFSAKASDDVGLKEIRLHAAFNTDKEEVLRLSCSGGAQVQLEKLAEFVIELAKRPNTKRGDTIVFHFEAEDTKGQVAATDVYTVNVRPWENFSAYGYHPVMAPHDYPGPALLNVIGAAWELHTKRDIMPKERFKRESEKIGRALEGPPGQ
ncbi:MAG: hypothetical protein NTW87_34785 [Planctomycetota bacterium]|nr:hypothetical protein [Planctomycetota bacterium]